MLDIFQGKGAEFFYKDLKLEDENKRWLKKHYLTSIKNASFS